jgi:hypothetical protein
VHAGRQLFLAVGQPGQCEGLDAEREDHHLGRAAVGDVDYAALGQQQAAAVGELVGVGGRRTSACTATAIAARCSAVMTSAEPVAVMNTSPSGTASAAGSTRKPRSTASSARTGPLGGSARREQNDWFCA